MGSAHRNRQEGLGRAPNRMTNSPKLYKVVGWVLSQAQPKWSDGIEFDLGEFDSLDDAEAVRRERLAVGWGVVDILKWSTAH